MRIVLAVALGSIGLPAVPAAAQVSDRLVACAARVDDADRLACYDAAVRSLNAEARRLSDAREAEAKTARETAAAAAAAAAAKAQAEAARQNEQLFGNVRATAEAAQQTESLTSRVELASLDAQKRAQFQLENGQIWRQTDGILLYPLRPGAEVIIKRGALGNFRMTFPGLRRTISVVRVR